MISAVSMTARIHQRRGSATGVSEMAELIEPSYEEERNSRSPPDGMPVIG